jgi:hypothetical protein
MHSLGVYTDQYLGIASTLHIFSHRKRNIGWRLLLIFYFILLHLPRYTLGLADMPPNIIPFVSNNSSQFYCFHGFYIGVPGFGFA